MHIRYCRKSYYAFEYTRTFLPSYTSAPFEQIATLQIPFLVHPGRNDIRNMSGGGFLHHVLQQGLSATVKWTAKGGHVSANIDPSRVTLSSKDIAEDPCPRIAKFYDMCFSVAGYVDAITSFSVNFNPQSDGGLNVYGVITMDAGLMEKYPAPTDHSAFWMEIWDERQQINRPILKNMQKKMTTYWVSKPMIKGGCATVEFYGTLHKARKKAST